MQAIYDSKCSNPDCVGIRKGDTITRTGSVWAHEGACRIAWVKVMQPVTDTVKAFQNAASGQAIGLRAPAAFVTNRERKQDLRAAADIVESRIAEWAAGFPGMKMADVRRAVEAAADAVYFEVRRGYDACDSRVIEGAVHGAQAWLQAEWDGTHAYARNER